MESMKPLGSKAYGSIPHLIGSKTGTGDHTVHQGQHDICTTKTRDKHDVIIVQEKFDGSNVAVAKTNGQILALTRAGYLAETSPYEMHHAFANWVRNSESLFKYLLNEGERICGELMLQAHGVKYCIDAKNPIIWFDLMRGIERETHAVFMERTAGVGLYFPPVLWNGDAITIENAFSLIDTQDKPFPFWCLEKPEGIVYRVERKGKVDFLAKWVRPDFETGKYLNLSQTIWNISNKEP
jgi:RNA ligase